MPFRPLEESRQPVDATSLGFRRLAGQRSFSGGWVSTLFGTLAIPDHHGAAAFPQKRAPSRWGIETGYRKGGTPRIFARVRRSTSCLRQLNGRLRISIKFVANLRVVAQTNWMDCSRARTIRAFASLL